MQEGLGRAAHAPCQPAAKIAGRWSNRPHLPNSRLHGSHWTHSSTSSSSPFHEPPSASCRLPRRDKPERVPHEDAVTPPTRPLDSLRCLPHSHSSHHHKSRHRHIVAELDGADVLPVCLLQAGVCEVLRDRKLQVFHLPLVNKPARHIPHPPGHGPCRGASATAEKHSAYSRRTQEICTYTARADVQCSVLPIGQISGKWLI
ncbi:hypothetical protein F751_5433 [Auxenochlorella protothecoides]|uniref:Uncharacterized protein n=1 Tax=Auxenochlorella protothecoides TaxID=3075 RepID=A0A087SQ64_AUXPR|nr:hypothetical protein F751_5433 [Auxenochlorella protothecoides]KFM27868.1 hypothetical protein F751_5433 [Auxenochlorella protothecoides]